VHEYRDVGKISHLEEVAGPREAHEQDCRHVVHEHHPEVFSPDINKLKKYFHLKQSFSTFFWFMTPFKVKKTWQHPYGYKNLKLK